MQGDFTNQFCKVVFLDGNKVEIKRGILQEDTPDYIVLATKHRVYRIYKNSIQRVELRKGEGK